MFLPGDMASYLEALNSGALIQPRFWLVLRIKKKDFGERLEMHPNLELILPKDGFGEFVGVVRNQEELVDLISPDPKNPDDKKKDYIYLTYKVKVQGQTGWKKLLEFLAQNEFLEEDSET